MLGGHAHNSSPTAPAPAAEQSTTPVASALATAAVHPVAAVAAATAHSVEAATAAVQTVEAVAVAATSSFAVGRSASSPAPVMAAGNAWGRVAVVDTGAAVTRTVQTFAADGAARLAGLFERIEEALPGSSAATADFTDTTPRMYEFAHMGWPVSLLADSVASFADDSLAATGVTGGATGPLARGTAAQSAWGRAWTVTAAVVAADVVLLTYINRSAAVRRRRAARAARVFATGRMLIAD